MALSISLHKTALLYGNDRRPVCNVYATSANSTSLLDSRYSTIFTVALFKASFDLAERTISFFSLVEAELLTLGASSNTI